MKTEINKKNIVLLFSHIKYKIKIENTFQTK